MHHLPHPGLKLEFSKPKFGHRPRILLQTHMGKAYILAHLLLLVEPNLQFKNRMPFPQQLRIHWFHARNPRAGGNYDEAAFGSGVGSPIRFSGRCGAWSSPFLLRQSAVSADLSTIQIVVPRLGLLLTKRLYCCGGSP